MVRGALRPSFLPVSAASCPVRAALPASLSVSEASSRAVTQEKMAEKTDPPRLFEDVVFDAFTPDFERYKEPPPDTPPTVCVQLPASSMCLKR